MLMKKTRVCNQTEKSTALYKTNSDLVLYQTAFINRGIPVFLTTEHTDCTEKQDLRIKTGIHVF